MKDFASELKNAKTVAIAGHVKPDGDCVGSCLATYNYIATWFPGIQADLYLEPIPNIFKFLKNADKICSSYDSNQAYDLCIVQDCGDTGRLGEAVKYFKTAKRTLCIDHHISNQSFADENHIFPEISSTSELVYGLMEEEKVTKEIAECIYVGMVHDTGVFQYSSTTSKTMQVAGALMDKGIDFPKIVDDTFFAKTFAQNKILGQALLNSELYLGGKVAATSITREEMAKYQAYPRHLEGIVSQLRVTKGVEAAVFFYENEDGTWKLSMRSNGKVDVAEIAVGHGGGGHVRAAGATMEGNVQELIQEICVEIAQQLGSRE
ncbi:MAG: bifunctional oligoribonuclease/PAP phosphatase NrnA [Lachnospiraceae bacterium]|jgi:phosphoesterase RecJ-like protein|nr:bifunctional oligoribonuclease/PAP phosphatase NrnA [Lachnospiraceae bacterium]